MRIGFGYDIHRLEAGETFVIGGEELPVDYGLVGHSDADVLTHALMDALLGAAGRGDIGRHFPDDDPAFSGADSLELLARVMEMCRDSGLEPVNADLTIVAERPRMSPYISVMTANLARVMGLGGQDLNIKATTNEGLGSVGRGEAVAAYAAVMLK